LPLAVLDDTSSLGGVRLAPSSVALGFACAVACLPSNARARSTRRHFEPTDLEMERAGTLDVDLQLGLMREAQNWRGSVPDFEVDFGLAPGVELDLDGAYHVDGAHQEEDGAHDAQGSFDNLWVAAKLGLYDSRVPGQSRAWAVGVQVGPKLPLAADARGLGAEALLLFSETWGSHQLVVNGGGFVDPADGASTARSRGMEGGLDLNLDTGAKGLAVTGELGGVHFLPGSTEKDQLHATAGLSWAANDHLDLSLIGLVGLLGGGERGGVLVGVSPKFDVWR